MQSASANTDLNLKKLKMFLQGFAIFFGAYFYHNGRKHHRSPSRFTLLCVHHAAVVYGVLATLIGYGAGLGFCFIPALGIAIGFPWGASKVVGILHDNPSRAWYTFFVEGIPLLFGKRSAARENHIRTIDPESRSGRFTLSRYEMADVLEKTAIRVWCGICCFVVGALLYIMTLTIEVRCDARSTTDPRHPS